MFFSKNKNSNETTAPTETTSLPEDKPIYIVGESSAALFLAACLQKNGENVRLVSTDSKSSFKEFTLKEEYNLQKNKFKIRRVSLMDNTPKLIILAPEPFRLKASLACLSASKAQTCPIISINIFKDISLFKPLLGKEFVSCYLRGCFNTDNNLLTAVGCKPALICGKSNIDENRGKEICELLKLPSLPLEIRNNEDDAFWQYFAPYSLAALNSLINGKNPPASDSKELFAQALKEVSSLAKIAKEDIVKTLSDIPSGYVFEIVGQTAQGLYGELNTIHERLTEKAKQSKIQTPALKILLKECFNRQK